MRGNGESVYFAKDAFTVIGMNKAECNNIDIYIKNKKPSRIVLLKNPKATLYPLDDIPADGKLLKGFKWQQNKRPFCKDDIFKW